MSPSSSDFAELFNLLMADDRRRSIPENLSPYLSRLGEDGKATLSNHHTHRRAKSEAVIGSGEFPSSDSQFPFTFKQMIHTLYDAQTWGDKVMDVIEESKNQFKSLPEELKSPRLSSRESSNEEGSQIRTIKKRCTGRTHIPDPVFVPKPTYVSHHARSSTVDLHIGSHKMDATPSPSKRPPSQTRSPRSATTLYTGARRPRHKSLTQLDTASLPLNGSSPLSDSDDSEFDALITPTDAKPISPLPPLKIARCSNTVPNISNQPDTLKGSRQTGRMRSSTFGGFTSVQISPVHKTFEPDSERSSSLR